MIEMVSFGRRAGAPRLIDWTGERCVPWAPDVQVVYEHFHRYMWAAGLVEGRSVLDLGSGEGFGAALLAESAAHVVGVDVDELSVEHSRLNYASPKLEFEVGSALDLSAFADGSLGAVVAFEIIEHVREQERVLGEVARVLGHDGILVISTPDRRMYEQSRSEPNPFHERELTLAEFMELLGASFPHTAAWGQRTITGSHLNPLASTEADERGEVSEFFIERAGDEWRLAGPPAALYCVAIASKAPLPAVGTSSTLADCGLELVRVKERDTAAALVEQRRLEGEKEQYAEALDREMARIAREAEGERSDHAHAMHERNAQARAEREQLSQQILWVDEDLARSQQALAGAERTTLDLRAQVGSLEGQLAAARLAGRRAEESVTWQAFQKLRGRLYRAIGGERSLLARVLGASLRLLGRRLVARRPAPTPLAAESIEQTAPEVIEMPEHESPEVSLIIPLHAHAELTRACLHSIREHTRRVGYEVILIDDTADVDTKRLLEGVRGAKILRNEENLGYLRSMNRGAASARGKWLVLFNNDTVVTPGWLTAMLDCASSAPDVGVVTPKFLYPDGSLNEAGGIIWRDGTGVNYGRGDAPERFPYEYRRETDYGSAAALMVSAELWRDAGGFDERYLPMYYEDADLCFEARERGLRVLYEPQAVVVHVEGATAGNDAESGHKRFQEQNRPKFVAKWRPRLESEQLLPSPANVRAAANRHRGPHVLVIDHRIPMWDRDAGSLRILKIMQALLGLGARVSFMPENLAPVEPYTRGLQQLGIEVLYGAIDPNAELAMLGPTLSTAILCRPHPTSHWLDTVREFAPQATVVYDTVDLHWLREARRGALASSVPSGLQTSNGNMDLASISSKAKALRELELAMMRATDATIVASVRDREQVQRDLPSTRILVVPTVHEVEPYVVPPEGRSGVLFVGGFEHVPNVDAALCLVGEVMPRVWSELRDVRVSIVGASPPPEVQGLASPLVDVVGWVEDLQPLLEHARVMVAPLRFGAGMKGKVTQCLAAGLPVVTSTVGAEGLDVRDGESMLIADEPAEIADRIIRVCRDDALWRKVSVAGQSVVAMTCSPQAIDREMRGLLGERATAEEELAGVVESESSLLVE
jgi:GT2 family glycosyltransferase/SAM-dependent methyltransferase/glycosyltransferase involved in cell wall biosynthesis